MAAVGGGEDEGRTRRRRTRRMAVLPATDRQQGRGQNTKQRKKEEVCASVRVGADLLGANMADITAGRKAAQANARMTVFHRRGVTGSSLLSKVVRTSAERPDRPAKKGLPVHNVYIPVYGPTRKICSISWTDPGFERAAPNQALWAR